MQNSTQILVLLMLSVALLAGCGSGDNDDSVPETATFGAAKFGTSSWE